MDPNLDENPSGTPLAWLLAQGEDIAPIPGTKRVSRVEENTAAGRLEVSAEQVERLDNLTPVRSSPSARDTSSAMREENVEIVRRAVGVFNEGGFEGLGASDLATDDFEFHEPPEQPAPRVARGREEFIRIAGEFDAAWATHHSEPQEIRAIDEDRVLYVSVEHFKGRDGIELKAPFAGVFTLRDGKLVRWQAYWDKQRALDAAGLAE